jgi:hypothetical protein
MEIEEFSFDTGAMLSLPAKRIPAWSVRTAANITVVAFILLFCLI